jgi:hypothetical protein
MVPKLAAKMFMTLVVFSGGLCTANGVLAVVPAASDNATRRHGTQVRACVSPAGTLLAFVQHWHGAMSSTTGAGTMTFQDDASLVQQIRYPDFMLSDTAVSALDSQCATGITTSLISDCPSDSYRDDWAVYAFTVTGCSATASYTFLSGNTVVLMEACSGLYPATVSGSVACPPSLAAASATGDPHLQNIHGERFDLMKPGKHVLINIPRGERAEKSLLRVQADAKILGGQCTDMYFQEVNITGAWAGTNAKTGGLRYHAQDVGGKRSHWMRFGPVQLKVAHGHTRQGMKYLNLYVKGLGRSGFAVGGLLGEDDHSEEEIPEKECAHRMAL